jgi:hypothetical protein
MSSMIITTEAPHNQQPPVLHRDDVTVVQGKDRIRASDLVPEQGDQGALDLYILIDDGSDSRISLQYNDIRKFMTSQPASTRIGIGYLRNGSVQSTQELTSDHERAGKALRLPMGPPGIAASPYTALSDLIKKWPATQARREVLMISSGIDLYYGPGPDNPYLQSAISDAQRAGVLVYTIYYGAEGHLGHSYWRMNWGQNYLAQLSDETGGEAYWQGNINPVSFTPFLSDLSRKLNAQYRLTFEPHNGKGLERVKVTTEVKGIEIIAASRAWVPSR